MTRCCLNAVRLVLPAVFLFAGTNSASAAFVTYFGQDLNGSASTRLTSTPLASSAQSGFLSGLTGVGTESFESIPTGNYSGLNLTFPGAGSATLTGPAGSLSIVNLFSGTNGVGRYPTHGNRFLETTSGMTINFTAPIAAFGFKATDVGDFGGKIILTLSGGGTQVINLNNATGGGAEGSVLFFGVIGTSGSTFTSIQFSNTAAGTDFFGFDEMTVGSPQQVVLNTVPAPAGAVLFAVGMAGLGGFRALRRRKSEAVA
jgi:hypothetical protein